MSILYFPSCKLTAQLPQISVNIQNYLKDTYNAEIEGCCRTNLNRITDKDTVVYICNTCAAFFNESTPANKIISIWELLINDTKFSFPDYKNKKLTMQDCWRTYDNKKQQTAIRQILDKMNVEIIELEDNYEKTKYCGTSLYEPLPDQYDVLAPKRLVKNAGSFFQPHTQQEKELLMQQHCSKITTDEVVCYCMACISGINLGGKKGIHLAEIVFGYSL